MPIHLRMKAVLISISAVAISFCLAGLVISVAYLFASEQRALDPRGPASAASQELYLTIM